MNRLSIRRIAALMITILIFSSTAFSQLNNVDFLRSAPADGVKFIEGYAAPWAKAFGAGLNGSWYNTAKPHKLGGFDLTLGFNVGVVPSSAQTFDLSTLNLPAANYSPNTGLVPTVAGSKNGGQSITYSQGGNDLATFTTPGGTGWKYIPVPTLQVGIGLPLGTELKVRYIPTLPISDGKIGLWGVGLMHSIMQYIPGNKLLPIDVSVFAGYTKLTGNVPLNLQPEAGFPNTITLPLNNQSMVASVSALNISAIASLSIPILTVYGGLGYSKTNTNVELEGNFPTPKFYVASGAVEYKDDGVKKGDSFPAINIKDFSGVRANIGLRVKLAVVTIHLDYTRAQYNVLSAGLGISFR